ncbi:MAG: hypothetical protein K0S44_233 [Bacteroidetes bacterium]|jgi:hypothetical protein|nr:hypothetical protein [Bacteroidota bacterium]
MNLSIETLKTTLSKLNYRWYNDRPNIIGIRTTLSVPDVFNDVLCIVYPDNGKEVLKTYLITTEPGVKYQKQLLNPKGCAVIKPGQYENAYAVGFHQGKTDHRALIQSGLITVIRDKDLDGTAGNSGTEDSGYFGCNIHGANKLTKTEKIGAWSAGCQVHAVWSNKEEMVNICEKFKTATGNRFTYTLIKETDLV